MVVRAGDNLIESGSLHFRSEYKRINPLNLSSSYFTLEPNGISITELERWHKSLKSECIRPGTLLSLEDAKLLIQQYVDLYNYVRLHSAIG